MEPAEAFLERSGQRPSATWISSYRRSSWWVRGRARGHHHPHRHSPRVGGALQTDLQRQLHTHGEIKADAQPLDAPVVRGILPRALMHLHRRRQRSTIPLPQESVEAAGLPAH